MEKIFELLGKELSTQVKEKLGDVQLAIANDGTWMPVDKYDKLKVEHKATLDQLEKANTSIADLSKSGDDVQKYKDELTKISTEYEQFKADASKRETDMVKSNKLKDALSKVVTPDAVDLLIGTFNLDELNVNEAGEIVDIDSKIGRIVEQRPSLKIQSTVTSNVPKDKQTPTQVDYSKLSDEEYYAIKAQEASNG